MAIVNPPNVPRPRSKGLINTALLRGKPMVTVKRMCTALRVHASSLPGMWAGLGWANKKDMLDDLKPGKVDLHRL